MKTRLAPALTEQEAAGLYEAFLRDSLEAYATLPVDLRVYLPESDAPPAGLLPPGAALCRQRGEGLGQRLLGACVETFRAGYERLVVIGTDHPTLPLAFVQLALDELVEPLRVVLGPTEDGGFYLIGMNDLLPSLFVGMTYSHDAVFEQTLARAAASHARPVVLPAWYDVDRPTDLARLAADLAADSTIPAPRTRELMANLGPRVA